MYMANASPSAGGPNATYVPLGPVGHARLRAGYARLSVGSTGVCVGCFGVFGYQHLQCDAMGVLPKAKPQREWFCVAVEYRL